MRSGGLSTQCAVRQERAEQLVPSGPGAPRLPSLRESRSAGIGQAPPKRPAGCCEIPSPDDGSTVATSRRRACIGLLTSDLSSIDDCRYKLA